MRTLLALLALGSTAAAQSTWYVDAHVAGPGSGSQADPYRSIQYAIDHPLTVDGDTLSIAAGVYAEQLDIEKDITLRGSAGPLATLVRSNQAGRVAHVKRGAIVESLSIVLEGAFPSRVVEIEDGTLRRCIVIGGPNSKGVLVPTFGWGSVERSIVTGNDEGIVVPPVGSVSLHNSIIWGNIKDLAGGGYVFTSHCIGFGNGFVVTGFQFEMPVQTIRGDPLVRDLAGHDFHLLTGSPCIDAGDPTSPLDPDGSRADIGPLPFDAGYAAFTTYCTAKINSLGCVPSIAASGTPSASSSTPFTITCANELNQRLGLYFYGFAPRNSAYQGGYLCVQSPVRRTQLINSGGNVGPDDCSGVYSLDFNALIDGGDDPLLEPGVEVFLQCWSRDPSASFGTNRSDALRFRVQP